MDNLTLEDNLSTLTSGKSSTMFLMRTVIFILISLGIGLRVDL